MILHLTDPHFGTERPEVVQGLLALTEQRRPRLPKSEAGSRGIPRRCRRPGRAGDPPRRFLRATLKIVVGLS